MSVKVERTERRGIFYGWWIVISATMVMALNGGVYYYGFSTFYVPLMKEFGWSSAALSGVVSISRLESGIAAPVVGLLIDRFGPRRLMILGFSMVGLGFIFIARIDSIVMLYIVFIALLSMGASMGFFLPVSSTVAKWFVRKRGMALGITMCGPALGAMLALPLLGLLIEQSGWRVAAVAVGVLFLAAGVPLSLVMRHRPEPFGYLPDGDDPVGENGDSGDVGEKLGKRTTATRNTQPSGAIDPAEISYTPREALSSSSFWMFSISSTCRMLANTGIAVHLIPALQNLGYPLGMATLIAGIMTAVSIPPRFGFGWLADRFDVRLLAGVCMVMQFLGVAAMAYAGDLTMIVVFLILYAPAYGGTTPLTPAVWGAYFGRHSFATISGLGQLVTMVGTFIGPLAVGYAFDVTGNYYFGFMFLAVMSLIGVVPLFFMGKPRAKQAIPTTLPPVRLA